MRIRPRIGRRVVMRTGPGITRQAVMRARPGIGRRVGMRARPGIGRLAMLALALAVFAALLFVGCGGDRGDSGSDGSPAGNPTGVRFPADGMLHLQQVLERYDAEGKAIPQYLELWLAGDRGRCAELDKDGRELAVALDTGNAEEWVKLYVDQATGYVLLCDAETFRLRTKLMEEIPLDETLFSPQWDPEGGGQAVRDTKTESRILAEGGNDQ